MDLAHFFITEDNMADSHTGELAEIWNWKLE